MNEKQQQLTFDKGITNVPSDILCSDNALEESVGMIYDNGEHRVIQNPINIIDMVVRRTEEPVQPSVEAPKFLYIHKLNDMQRFIGAREITESGVTKFYISWCFYKYERVLEEVELIEVDADSIEDILVSSIGKTLIYSDKKGQHYMLWQGSQDDPIYKKLPDIIPDPKINFWLKSERDIINNSVSGETRGWVETNLKIDGAAHYDDDRLVIDSQEQYNDTVVGCYSKNLKSIARAKGFCKPFFVRYALKMYDDSYTHISNPVLLLPCVTGNSRLWVSDENVFVATKFEQLYCSVTIGDLALFSDVIKDIVIFVSNGVDPYDTSMDQKPIRLLNDRDSEVVVIDGIYRPGLYDEQKSVFVKDIWSYDTESGMYVLSANYSGHSFDVDNANIYNNVFAITKKPTNEFINEIKGTSIFYKICSIGLKDSDSVELASKFETHTLENLTTQEQLPEDDYFSRSRMNPGFMYAYNSRLNLANVSRYFFDGFDFFLPYDKNSPSDYLFFVTIKTDYGEYLIKHSVENCLQKQGLYFYYPDSRASHVLIYKDSSLILDEDLEEHEGLNGAFYFKELPTDNEQEQPIPGQAIPQSYDNGITEQLPNYIITSEVNNPWVFKAEGYNKVGTGKVIGMSTITQALSQGQFGQYPLLVFSESGIWAMSVNNTGLFSSIHPMSREVCNNPTSITQTDGAVFFSSEKGLMVIAGSDVKCVSEQLNGRESLFSGEIEMGNFRDYIRDCFIAYDYRDSLLWIFNHKRSTNNNYCYIYSINAGTFGKYEFDEMVKNSVNDYPDYLLQKGRCTLLSLTGRTNINLDDSDDYSGLMITRPMKLENGLALKSIMQIRNISYMEGSMTLRIFASNNLNDWVELHSLRGMPWKYYRFRYDLSDMKATDRFGGSVLITQERRTNKLR